MITQVIIEKRKKKFFFLSRKRKFYAFHVKKYIKLGVVSREAEKFCFISRFFFL